MCGVCAHTNHILEKKYESWLQTVEDLLHVAASLCVAGGSGMWDCLKLKPLAKNEEVTLNLSSSSLGFKGLFRTQAKISKYFGLRIMRFSPLGSSDSPCGSLGCCHGTLNQAAWKLCLVPKIALKTKTKFSAQTKIVLVVYCIIDEDLPHCLTRLTPTAFAFIILAWENFT